MSWKEGQEEKRPLFPLGTSLWEQESAERGDVAKPTDNHSCQPRPLHGARHLNFCYWGYLWLKAMEDSLWVIRKFSSCPCHPGSGEYYLLLTVESEGIKEDKSLVVIPQLNACSMYRSYVCWKKKVKVKLTQSCPTLFDPMDYTVHGILQARILEWVAIPFSRGSSQPRDWTQVSLIASEFFTSWATREAQFGDFPGDPMAKVPCPQCRGWDSIPSWGTRSCVLQLSTDWRE